MFFFQEQPEWRKFTDLRQGLHFLIHLLAIFGQKFCQNDHKMIFFFAKSHFLQNPTFEITKKAF